MSSKKIKPQLPPENSVVLRVMVCLMWIVAISASFFFGETPVPGANFTAMQGAALVLSIWLCVGGGIYSYHYRDAAPPSVKTLIKLGVGLMILNLVRELFEANMGAMQFQLIRPLMHALVASSVLTSFEMRTRPDIIQSATFGLLLLCVAAVSGKSILFGGIVFLYICFGTALLVYSCRSQTRSDPSTIELTKPMVKILTKRNVPLASFIIFTTVPLLSAAAFCVMPRMDNEADGLAAQMRTSLTAAVANLRASTNKQGAADYAPHFKPGPNKLKVARIREELRHQALAGKPSPAPHTLPRPAVHAHAASEPELRSKSQPDPKRAVASGQAVKPQADDKRETPPGEKSQKPKNPVEKPDSAKQPRQPSATTPAAPKNKPASGKKQLDESKIDTNVPMQNPDDPLFTLACNRNVYTRMMAMDDFDGRTWRRSNSVTKWELAPNEKGIQFSSLPPMQITLDMPIMEVAQVYNVENDLGKYVPIAGIPQTLSLSDSVEVDSYANVVAHGDLIKGTKYSVTAQLPVFSLEALRRAPEVEGDPVNVDQYLQIPENQSREMYTLATRIAGNEGNRFVRAERILNHIRKNYAYSQTPMLGDDPQKNIVDVFLFDQKRGDCKAYASAFVMMCRAADIPARLTGGYLPGDFDSITGLQHVKRKHGHAWAEAWIPPNGWVPFDATPTGTLPARPEEQYYNYDRLTKEAQKYGERLNSTGSAAVKNTFSTLHFMTVIAAIGIGTAALFFGLRAAAETLRQVITELKNRHPASTIKRRVIKRLRRRGLLDSPTDSGGELIAKLRECSVRQQRSEELADEFKHFIDVYNAAYFGGEERLGDLRQLESRISKLSGG